MLPAPGFCDAGGSQSADVCVPDTFPQDDPILVSQEHTGDAVCYDLSVDRFICVDSACGNNMDRAQEEKLEKDKTIEDADRFAIISVWEIYQPVIDSVTSGYSLEVEFAD